MRRLAFAGLLMLALLALAAPAWAHGYIIRGIPEDRAALERAPLRVQVWFSEPLEPEFSQITVSTAAGEVIATANADPENPSLLAVRLPPGLPDGAYSVDLRIAFASDGHVINERRVFFVGEAGDLAGSSASDAVVPLEVVWRALSLGGALVLLGVGAVYALVLVPAWGSPTYRAGLLPPRVMTALDAVMLGALLAVLAGNLLALLQQTMVFFDADAGRVLSEGLWSVVRSGTRFGDTWNVRMIVLGVVAGLWGVSLWARRAQPAWVRPFWSAGAWASALLLGTYSLSSHAAGSPVLPWLALAIDWLHLCAVGMWAGGLAALSLVVPVALRPYRGEERRLALLAALNRFSPLAFGAALLVVATGIFSSLVWVTEPAQVGTRYGITLIAKIVLVLALLGLGALHRAVLKPERYARLAAWENRLGGPNRTLYLEAALGLVVIIAAALLSATPVPRPDIVSPPAPTATVEVGDTQVTLTLSPGGPGVNSTDVYVEQNGQPWDDPIVSVRIADPARDLRGAWHPADPAGDGLFVAANGDIDRAGPWLALVDVREGDELTRAAFPLNLSEDAALQLTRAPTFGNLLALAGVALMSVIVVWPLIRFGWNKLDRSPLALVLLVGGAILVVLIVAGGIWLSQESDAVFASYNTPLPAVVNPVLPDQASLERGQAALAASCPGWTESREFDELVKRLTRLRDEELWTAVNEGWRTLPACDAALPDAARWDIVNAVRSLEPQGERGA
ncbi:MAG: CopD family protein [Anaerolineae bacterium]